MTIAATLLKILFIQFTPYVNFGEIYAVYYIIAFYQRESKMVCVKRSFFCVKRKFFQKNNKKALDKSCLVKWLFTVISF